MKRFTDDTAGQPARIKTGWLISHQIDPDDVDDDIPEEDVQETEDDPYWNVTSIEARAARSVEERD
jgi:hypothetical protein